MGRLRPSPIRLRLSTGKAARHAAFRTILQGITRLAPLARLWHRKRDHIRADYPH
jgi:hypothetical protein